MGETERGEPEEVVSQDSYDAAVAGDAVSVDSGAVDSGAVDSGAVEEIAADMQKLSADWQRVQDALQAARQAEGPREAVERLETVRAGCATHLDELQRMRRKAIEALPSEMRGSVLGTFDKFYDDIGGRIESIDEELQRLRAEFNPLFRPPQ